MKSQRLLASVLKLRMDSGSGSGAQSGDKISQRQAFSWPPSSMAAQHCFLRAAGRWLIVGGAGAGKGASVYWTVLLALLSAIASSAFAARPAAPAGPLPIIDFELIADDSKIFAAEGGRFTAFAGPPSLDGTAVSFAARREDGRVGLYTSDRGHIELRVDTRTPIPQGRGNFTDFVNTPIAAGGRLAFRGLGIDGQQGIYLLVSDRLTRVSDTSMSMPNGGGQFSYFKRPAFDGPHVVFMARGGKRPADAGPTPAYEGTYRFNVETAQLHVVADWTTLVPGGAMAFGKMDDTSTGLGRALMTASASDGRSGVYALGDGALERIVDTTTLVPGRPNERFIEFDDAAADRSFNTDNLVFKLSPENADQNGTYALIGGQLIKIADVTDDMAGGMETFNRFRSPNIHGDMVFFVGYGASGQQGIYFWRNGKRHPLIDRSALLGGKQPLGFRISQEATSALGIAFQVTFEDGSQAIYLARLRYDAGRVVLSDPLNGKSQGSVQGGRFVPGGGWTVAADNDRIVWNLPPMSGNGLFEIDVRNFDPPKQITADKDIFVGLWGTLFRNHERMNRPHTDNWEFRVGTAHRQFKVEYHARGFGKAVEWVPFDGPFDPTHTYRIRFEWREGRLRTSVDERVLHFDGFDHEPVDHFRFLHVGTSSHFKGKVTLGPIYSNVRIIEFDPEPGHLGSAVTK